MTDGPRLSIIPGWIITDPRLKGKDLQVLCMLGRNANTSHGWCRRSQVKLAAALACSRSTVQSAINRLVEIGAVERREVVSNSGRDSAHWYRVIYDTVVPSDAFSAWEERDTEEFDPTDPFENNGTPAGIQAPPAGPDSAPPAGSGQAPINACSFTPPEKREERARDTGSEKQEENPADVEKAFRKFFFGWKTAVSDSQPAALVQWQGLSPSERLDALSKSEHYQAAAVSAGRKILCSAATYLKEKRWQVLASIGGLPSVKAPSEAYTAYSRAGRGLLLAEFLKPEQRLVLTPLEERIIETKPEKRDVIWRDKRLQHGWPAASKLIDLTVSRKRYQVPPAIVTASQDFDKVKVGGPVWSAWERLHQRRCWQWLPAPTGLEWMQFPRVDGIPSTEEEIDRAVEGALERYEVRLNEDRGDDHAE